MQIPRLTPGAFMGSGDESRIKARGESDGIAQRRPPNGTLAGRVGPFKRPGTHRLASPRTRSERRTHTVFVEV